MAIFNMYSNLGGLSFYEDADGNKYAVGADSVPKKLGSCESDNIKYYDSKSVTVSKKETAKISINLDEGLYIVFACATDEAPATNYHNIIDRIPNGNNVNVTQITQFAYIVEAFGNTTISINVGPCGSGSNGGGQGKMVVLSVK